MKDAKITALVVEPGKAAKEVQIDSSLASLQSIVGGYVEALYPYDDDVIFLCDEESKLKSSSQPNRTLFDGDGHPYDIIFGTFIIAGTDGDGIASLPEKMLKKYTRKYEHPDIFYKVPSTGDLLTVSDNILGEPTLLVLPA